MINLWRNGFFQELAKIRIYFQEIPISPESSTELFWVFFLLNKSNCSAHCMTQCGFYSFNSMELKKINFFSQLIRHGLLSLSKASHCIKLKLFQLTQQFFSISISTSNYFLSTTKPINFPDLKMLEMKTWKLLEN